MNVTKILSVAIALQLCGPLVHVPTALAWDYLIEESTDYTGNGCASSDVNTVTTYLEDLIIDDGGAGDRWANYGVWPQDWWESCSSDFITPGTTHDGIDDLYADKRGLAVYAGHGFKGNLHFGYKKHGACLADLGSNSRLGSMGGNDAAVAIYVTSCTMHTTSLVADANFQWVRQQLGFHNSPHVQYGSPGWFYASTGGPQFYSNTFAWTDYLEVDLDGDETNSPIAVSYGTTLTEAQNVRDLAKIRSNTYMTPRSGGPACEAGQPAFHFLWVMRNNGDC